MAGYRSLAQEQFFHRQMEEGKMKPGIVQKFDSLSEKNPMNLPNKVPMKKPPMPPQPGMPGEPPHADGLAPVPHPGMPPMMPHPAHAPGAFPAPGQVPGLPGLGAQPGMPGLPKPKTTQDLRDLFRQKFGQKKV